MPPFFSFLQKDLKNNYNMPQLANFAEQAVIDEMIT